MSFSTALLLLFGCTTPPPAPTATPPLIALPSEGLIRHRAVLSARGRQFALNGYLALSPTGGKRLVVTEHFGSVLADVLVKPDGRVYVMGHNPRFPAKWARRYLAADLECLCGGMPTIGCPLRAVDSNHYVIERGWYVLDLRTVETKPGPQPAQLFDETKASQGELKKAQKRL